MTARLRVGFLMGASRGEVLRRVTERIAVEFRDEGHDAEVLDMLAPGFYELLAARLTHRSFDLVVALQGWGLDLFEEGLNAFDRGRVPYVTILGDHPSYHAHRLRFASPRNAVLVQEAAHVEAVRTIVGTRPVVGVFAFVDDEKATQTPLETRPEDLLFLGSCGDPDAARAELGHDCPSARPLLLEALTRRLDGEPCRTFEALERAMAARGIDRARVPPRVFARFVSDVDRIVRNQRRLNIVRAVRSTRLTIWGEGWPRDLADRSNIRVQGEGYPTGAAAASRGRLLLNIFPDDFCINHDRLGLGLRCGTPILSEANPCVAAPLVAAGVVASFRCPAELDDVAGALLRDPAALEGLRSRGNRYLTAVSGSVAVESILKAHAALTLLGAAGQHAA